MPPLDRPSSEIGLHRVVEPAGVLPQAAWKLDNRPDIGPDEVRLRVERLNLDAASYRQLADKHAGDGPAIRAEVLDIVATRGKLHNPVTGSGGMLIGTVEQVGPDSPLGLAPGQRVATLVSLSLTPLAITDGLAAWDGHSEQAPCHGHAILFGRSIAAPLPDDLDPELALAVMDVCGAPALTARMIRRERDRDDYGNTVAVVGGSGKSGSLALAAARRTGANRVVGVVPDQVEARRLNAVGLADEVAVADARDPVAVREALGDPVDLTVVCVDVPGCEHGAILATAPGGMVIFFSMATSFAAAALGAEGLAADITMVIGNGYVPGHAEYALELLRTEPGVRQLFTARLAAESAGRRAGDGAGAED